MFRSKKHTSELTPLINEAAFDIETAIPNRKPKSFQFELEPIEPNKESVAKLTDLRICLLIIENAINKKNKIRNLKTAACGGAALSLLSVASYLTWLTFNISGQVEDQTHDILTQRKNILTTLGSPLNFTSPSGTDCSLSATTANVLRENYNLKIIEATRVWCYGNGVCKSEGYPKFDACLQTDAFNSQYFTPQETYNEIQGTDQVAIVATEPSVQEYKNLTQDCFHGLMKVCQLLTDDLPSSPIGWPIFGIITTSLAAISSVGIASYIFKSDSQRADAIITDDNNQFMTKVFGDNQMSPDLIKLMSHNLDSLNQLLNIIKRKIGHESAFSRAATSNMLLIWNPSKTSKRNANTPSGLPPDIGRIIGDYLTLQDAGKIAQTHPSVNAAAAAQVNKYFR